MNHAVQATRHAIHALREFFKVTNIDTTATSEPNAMQLRDNQVDAEAQETFVKFHTSLGEGKATLDNTCHCKTSSKAAEVLSKKNAEFTLACMPCDCGSSFQMPIPKSQFHQQNDQVFLDQLLRDGLLDYLWTSSSSCVSPDQPGAGSCVCTGLPLFTADPRVRDITDEAYLPLGLHPTPFLHYSRAMVIISIFSYACTCADGPANKFN